MTAWPRACCGDGPIASSISKRHETMQPKIAENRSGQTIGKYPAISLATYNMLEGVEGETRSSVGQVRLLGDRNAGAATATIETAQKNPVDLPQGGQTGLEHGGAYGPPAPSRRLSWPQ